MGAGKIEYLVKWVEYPDGDSWEPAENLRNVPEKIAEFKEAQQKKFATKKSEIEKKREKEKLEDLMTELKRKGSY